MHSKLSHVEIRKLAEEAGREHWKWFLQEGQEPILEQCLNFQGAWMFFRSPSIQIPEEASLRKCAIVVSDFGEVRFTADYYPNYNACMEYLKTMSEHFEERRRFTVQQTPTQSQT